MPEDLSPDAVLTHLATRWLGRPYFFEQQVDSTNSRLGQLASVGGAHGTVVAADRQTGGRGRLGRRWHSPAGVNLYFSALLRPGWEAPATPPLSLAAGVALAEAVAPLLPEPPTLKWPNDLLYRGQKLAGVLVETVTDQQAPRHVILGIGLNVNQQQFPSELADRAVSLRLATDRDLDRAQVLAAVLVQLERWIDCLGRHAAAPVVHRWQHYAPWMGEQVTVRLGMQELVGRAEALEADGRLRIRDTDGQEHRILAGDVSHGE